MGMGTGWVYQGGYTGGVPSCPGSKPRPAERVPEALKGLEWVGLGAAGVTGYGGHGDGHTHPCGARSVPAGPPWYDLAEVPT